MREMTWLISGISLCCRISDGLTVTEVAGQWKVSRQTLHGWLARYEELGLEVGLIGRIALPRFRLPGMRIRPL